MPVMREALIATVAVSGAAFHFDKLYDYLIPAGLEDKTKAGQRVLVPFGRGNRKRQGIITQVKASSEYAKLKPFAELLDTMPLFNSEMLALGLWIKEHTFCTYFDALRVMMPAGVNLRIVTSYKINPKFPADKLNGLPEQERLLVSMLLHSGANVERERLTEIMKLPANSELPDRLVKSGFIIRNDEAVQRMSGKEVKMVRLSDDAGELLNITKITPKQRAVTELLSEAGCASVRELCYFLGITAAVVTSLERKKIVAYFQEEVYRNPYNYTDAGTAPPIILNEQQQEAFDKLSSLYKQESGAAALLYGVTGSGKTQVFMKLIDEVSAAGRGVIVMVPEISLTPQTLSLFHSRYGGRVAVFHSALSVGQRMDEWKRVRDGDATIVVGTRSAVFAPFEDVGLIVIDEEQEHTYKSESTPRFHARDVSRFRTAFHKSLLVLASATPSVESYTAAVSGRYTLCEMNTRYGKAMLPEVVTVDMRGEIANGESGVLSGVLRERIGETLSAGHQAILLLNRRGHNTFISCRQCGQALTCKSCSISLTYHSANGRLMCHYCGASEEMTGECPQCGGQHIRCSGFGTQRAEQELEVFFPEARILRMDADSTMSRYSYEEKLSKFAAHEYDIMLGTQMVAKGLDFPNVTLVGVLTADQAMHTDDFRSFERTFSLLTQVVGRSGRGDSPGTAVIQTMTPESTVVQLAENQDYAAFYKTEMQTRRLMIFPPYCDFCMIGFVGAVYDEVKRSSVYFSSRLKACSETEYKDQSLIVLGPTAAGIPKLADKYRCKIIIKCKNSKRFREMLTALLIEYGKNPANKNVTAFVDINPNNIL